MSMPFFESRHDSLRNDYRDESGLYTESCGLIALEMAALLLLEGVEPRILVIRGEQLDNSGNRASLIPTPFEGRVTWGAHVVCEAAGVIYDPMLDQPLPVTEYLQATFNHHTDIEDVTAAFSLHRQ